MKDENIMKQFEEQNQNIYYNKLSIDIDNNFENITMRLENYINLMVQNILQTILEIETSIINKKKIESSLINMCNNMLSYLNDSNIKRKEVLSENIKNITKEKYQELLLNQNNNIIMEVEKKYIQLIENLYNELIINYTKFESDRLHEYLFKTNKDKLIIKINEIYNNTNIILLNNFDESLIKLENLNLLTTK